MLPSVYHEWAQKVLPIVRAALAGEETIPKQSTQQEALLTFALYWVESPITLAEFVAYADALDHAIPGEEEIAWTFLQIRKRGWLLVEEDKFGLTAEGRRAVSEIVGEGDVREMIGRFKKWFKAHPLPA